MKKKRILAIVVDYLIIGLICFIPIIIYSSVTNFEKFSIMDAIMIQCIAVLGLFKDLTFRNQSFGKKIMKIKIVKADNKIPSILDTIDRKSYGPFELKEFKNQFKTL